MPIGMLNGAFLLLRNIGRLGAAANTMTKLHARNSATKASYLIPEREHTTHLLPRLRGLLPHLLGVGKKLRKLSSKARKAEMEGRLPISTLFPRPRPSV